MATEAIPTRTITTSAAYQFTGICPRYVAPPPVAAARATDLPEELLAMAGGNPTAWPGTPWAQAPTRRALGRRRASPGRASPDGIRAGTPARDTEGPEASPPPA